MLVIFELTRTWSLWILGALMRESRKETIAQSATRCRYLHSFELIAIGENTIQASATWRVPRLDHEHR